jgi:hypothetical protein
VSPLHFEEPAESLPRLLVKSPEIEDAGLELQFAERELLPRLFRRDPVVLDFQSITTCTQSHVHALLYQPLRVAWALKASIYIVNAPSAVRSMLVLVENYALAG